VSSLPRSPWYVRGEPACHVRTSRAGRPAAYQLPLAPPPPLDPPPQPPNVEVLVGAGACAAFPVAVAAVAAAPPVVPNNTAATPRAATEEARPLTVFRIDNPLSR